MVPDVQATFIDDSMRGLAVGIDQGAIAGTGSSGQPLGLIYDSGIPVVSLGVNGGAPSNALLASMLAALGNNNGMDGVSLGFATTPNGGAALRTAFRNGTGSKALLDGKDFVLGCAYQETTNLPSNITKGSGTGLSACVLGSWASLTIGLWPLYLLVDPYKQSTTGNVLMTWFQDVDTQVRQANEFVTVLDMITP